MLGSGAFTWLQRADSIEAGWRVVQPILNVWKDEGARDLPIYAAGSSGPKEANRLLLRDGHRWRTI